MWGGTAFTLGRILEGMARNKNAEPKPPKAPKGDGRIKQMYAVYKMTRKFDPSSTWWMAAGFFLPLIIGVVAAVLLFPGQPFPIILWTVTALLIGVLAFLIILGRKAERAAYSQIEGQPGAVGAVLKSSLRRGWIASEMPVAVSPKTQDAVYRAVGRGGVVLIGEGPLSRTTRMVDDERRKVARILPNVTISTVYVGPDSESVALYKIPRTLGKLKKSLTKAEIFAVNNRLSSLTKNAMPIPKGVDPFKARPARPR